MSDMYSNLELKIEEPAIKEKYPYDISKQDFLIKCHTKQEMVDLVKWCRKTFGSGLGDGWNYNINSFSSFSLTITIQNSTLLTLWNLYK